MSRGLIAGLVFGICFFIGGIFINRIGTLFTGEENMIFSNSGFLIAVVGVLILAISIILSFSSSEKP